jgi:thymidylate synthase
MSKAEAIFAENLSEAWSKVFLRVYEQPASNPLTDLTVSFSVYGEEGELFPASNNEVPEIRQALDHCLTEKNQTSVQTVASTIFPVSQWNSSHSSSFLYQRYADIWHRIRKYPANYNGTYFQRMIAYGWEENKDELLLDGRRINQLQHVIDTIKGGNTRRSAYAVSIFNPHVDHTHQKQRGFPCLQHVHFMPENDGLIITGVYATQNIFEKAYGNYLGLYHLGKFMAHEMGMNLLQVRCKSSRVKHAGNTPKKDFDQLVDVLKSLQ